MGAASIPAYSELCEQVDLPGAARMSRSSIAGDHVLVRFGKRDMSTLVSITAQTRPPGDCDRPRTDPHTACSRNFSTQQCNCRCVMCDIWRFVRRKNSTRRSGTASRFLPQLGVRWVVLSGGEPQLNEKWSYLSQMLRTGCRVTLLTAGLLLNLSARQSPAASMM